MVSQRLGEFDLIARYFQPLADPDIALGLMDAAAVFPAPVREDFVLTKDLLTADVHFFADDPPDMIARKALRVNISDLVAKGARPLGYLLGLSLAGDWDENWVAGFASGLAEDQEVFGIKLLGGDTIKNRGLLTVSITAIGTVSSGRAVLRNAARPGDIIYVSGTIGDAALGLLLRHDPDLAREAGISKEGGDLLVGRYLLPQPRLNLANALRAHAIAAMDISDGLMGDLAKLCAASGVSATVNAGNIPVSGAASALLAKRGDLWTQVYAGGDDYELLVPVTQERSRDFENACRAAGTDVAAIGEIVTGTGEPRLVDSIGRDITLPRKSFEHF